MTKKDRLGWLKPFGILMLVVAVVGCAANEYVRTKNGWPFDPGYFFSHLAIALLGTSVWWIANCLSDLESRIEELEKRASTHP